jgi:hypothetical protein
MGAAERVMVWSVCPEINWASEVGDGLADETDGVTGFAEYGVLGGYARG